MMDIDRRHAMAMTMALGAGLLLPKGAEAKATDGSPLVSHPFDALRRLYSAADDKPRCWWYDLETFAIPDGWPTLHLLSMRALFACRSRLVSPDEMLVDYVDIGIFLDPTTGKPIGDDWVNPITRQRAVNPPLKVNDWHGGYRVVRNGDGVRMTTRGSATVAEVEARYRETDQAAMIEYERITQGPAGTSSYKQSIWGSRAALKDPKAVSVDGLGSVESHRPGLPAWAGFGDIKGKIYIQGSMRKSALNAVLNPSTMDIIKPYFPDWFVDGAYTPRWPTYND